MQLTTSLSPEQLANLSAGESIVLEVEGGKVTLTPPEKRVGKRFANFEELSASMMAPVEFTCEFKPGELVTFKIRPIDADLAKKCDDIGADVKPPKKQKGPVGRSGVVNEELDWEDEKFLEARSKVNSLKRAFVLVHGLMDFAIPGENLEEQAKVLRAKLPPRVVEALYNAIGGLTSDPVKQADFS